MCFCNGWNALKKNDARRDSGFTLFYMCFNFGAFVAPLICGFLQKEYGWHFGFGAGGIGMLLAVIIFYLKTMPDLKEFDEKVGIDATWDRPSKKKQKCILHHHCIRYCFTWSNIFNPWWFYKIRCTSY